MIRSSFEKKKWTLEDEEDAVVSYVDMLVHLRLFDSNQNLNDNELAGFRTEFIISCIDASIITMHMTMANIMKYLEIQKRLVKEIDSLVEPGQEIREEDLKMMPFPKAVV